MDGMESDTTSLSFFISFEPVWEREVDGVSVRIFRARDSQKILAVVNEPSSGINDIYTGEYLEDIARYIEEHTGLADDVKKKIVFRIMIAPELEPYKYGVQVYRVLKSRGKTVYILRRRYGWGLKNGVGMDMIFDSKEELLEYVRREYPSIYPALSRMMEVDRE